MAKSHRSLLKLAKERARRERVALATAEALAYILGREIRVEPLGTASLCVYESVAIRLDDAIALVKAINGKDAEAST